MTYDGGAVGPLHGIRSGQSRRPAATEQPRRGQASALALSASNSDWVMAPESSMDLALAIWSAGLTAAESGRNLFDVLLLLGLQRHLRHLPLGHAPDPGR